MKVRFYMDTGANIHSSKTEVIDLCEYLGLDDEEEARKTWESMTDDEKHNIVDEWAWNSGLEIGYDDEVDE